MPVRIEVDRHPIASRSRAFVGSGEPVLDRGDRGIMIVPG
jgi:hypothetical protein